MYTIFKANRFDIRPQQKRCLQEKAFLNHQIGNISKVEFYFHYVSIKCKVYVESISCKLLAIHSKLKSSHLEDLQIILNKVIPETTQH